jgi:NADH-quinone oxidoreductase subunit H
MVVNGKLFNRIPILYIILAVVALLVVVVILLLANWGAVLEAGTNVLNFIFNPASRADPNTFVVCRENSACMTIWAFVYSALLLFVVITSFAYTTLLERRLISWFQARIGPNRVGPAGLLQPAADGLKLATKEDILPAGASRVVWFLSPLIKVVPTLIVLAVIPLGPDLLIPWFDGKWYQVSLYLADPNVGVLWLLAITSIGTYGIVLAGWSSANKYAMLGALRSSAQMISYELSLGLTMAVPILIVGSMSLGDIIGSQTAIWEWFIFRNPLAAAVLFVALLAEINRAPFDLPEAEQELTAGYMTEYSGMKFAMFMMAEYLGMIGVALIVWSLFLGGYQDGFGLVDNVPILGPLVIGGKIFLTLAFMIWIRATLPRIRYDRLMHFGWKVMLPLALLSVSWTAVSVYIGDAFNDTLVYAIVSGAVFGLVVLGSLYILTRRTRAEVEAEALDLDPLITGERGGLGYLVLQAVGTLISIPFALFGWTVRQLENLSTLGEQPEEQPREEAPAPRRGPRAKEGGTD